MKISILLSLILAVLTSTISALAQVEDPQLMDPFDKSPATAIKWSVFGTLVPIALGLSARESGGFLVVSGIMLGPSAGYFYGRCGSRGMKGILARTGMLAGTVLLAGAAASTQEGWDALGAAAAVFTIGALAITCHSIYDIASVGETVQRRNNGGRLSLGITPYYDPNGSRMGLNLCANF